MNDGYDSQEPDLNAPRPPSFPGNRRPGIRLPDPGWQTPGRPAAAPAFSIDATSVLEPVLRRWRSLLFGGGVAMAAGLALGLGVWHRSYTCTAQLVRYDPPVASDAFHPQALATPTLVSMLQAPDLLQHIGREFQPVLSAKQLAGRLQLTAERNTDIVSVAVSGDEPKSVAALANLYCREAVKFTQETQRAEAVEADAYVTRQLQDTEADLAAARLQVPVSVQTPLDPSTPADKLSEKIQAAREELANLLLRYTEAHPLVREQRAKLAALAEQYAHRPAADQSRAVPGRGPAHSPAAAAPASREDYQVVLDRLRTLETTHGALVARQRAIAVFKASPPGYFRLLLPASADDALMNSPWLKISLFVVFCGALGVAATTGEALFRELVDNRLKTSADVRRVARLPVLATLGDLRALPTAARDRWAFRTWIALQSRLSHSPNHGMVCGVTSSRPSDGRSTWVNLLAQAASQCGFRVLTIATRPPPEPGRFGAVPPAAEKSSALQPGATAAESTALTASVLAAPAQVAEKLSGPDAQPMVHIPLPGWVWNLERRKQWQSALNVWRQIENVVILVELPPASVPEAVLLAENIPNLIWLAESGKSDAAETRTLLETLRHARCNLVGAVLNREPASLVNGHFARWAGCLLAFAALGLPPHGLRSAETAGTPPVEPAPAVVPGAATFSVVTPAQRAAWQEHLTLGPGDIVNLSLFGEPTLTREAVPVGPDGRISYLEAQNVEAAGLTIDEFRARLDQELGNYRRAPQAFVVPVAFHSKKYYVLGKVVQKGVFPLDRPTTIVEAVASAHGLESGLVDGNLVELADFSRSFLARGGRHLPVDFEKLFTAGDLTQNIPLEPDDYLYFPAGDLKEIYVLGEVRFPGPQAFTADTGALEAIAARGGFTERAWKRRLLIVRGSLSHPETFVVDAGDVLAAHTADFKLQPKDIVYVSNRPWIRGEELLDAAASAFVESAVVTWTGLHVDGLKRP